MIFMHRVIFIFRGARPCALPIFLYLLELDTMNIVTMYTKTGDVLTLLNITQGWSFVATFTNLFDPIEKQT